MSQRTPTRQKILEASQRLFNERGYAGTTLAEIASTAGIAEGNLWYHFPTKLDLVIALETRLREEVREALARRPTGGSVSDDYVESIVFSMKHQWENRFLLRDHLEFSTDGKPFRRDPTWRPSSSDSGNCSVAWRRRACSGAISGSTWRRSRRPSVTRAGLM